VTVTLLAELKVQDNTEVPEPPDTVDGDRPHEALSLVNETSPVNPFKGSTMIVEVPATPTLKVTLVGLAARAKSGPAVTVTTVTLTVVVAAETVVPAGVPVTWRV